MPTPNAHRLLAILALICQLPYSLQQDEPEEQHGHTHDLDPMIFTDFAATDEPIGSIMTLHLASMILAFGIIYPIGMVLGLVKSRWHVPVQVLGSLVFVGGFFLAHAHSGRNYEPHNAHRGFAWFVVWSLVAQVAMGFYLKLHLEKGIHGRIRSLFVTAHRWLGILVPVIGYTQIVLGVIAIVGFCYGEHTGQCLAHFIMGSSFAGYGIIMLISLRVGGPWLLKRKRSQEWYDSWMITLWGIVNTFTEHRWGSNWNSSDYQHTSMGIIWVAAGTVGIWLSRNEQRSVVPSLVIALTAAAFQGHAQHVANSGHIHSFFGYMLMAGAISRIVEICFVWKKGVFTISPWQYMPPMFLMMAGVIFMGATEQQLSLLATIGIDPASYINVLLSFAFFLFLYTNILLGLWERLSGYDNQATTEGYTEVEREELHDGASFLEDDEDDYTKEHNALALGSLRQRD
ncbi:hypothetical protein INT44_004308 [Umbelopsis vinacea]|uniref:Cytochrome b561 domain-containing protein n=1 Tax=Umbelopsis vinacea TaxID=44442 RepID=A0A8H7QCZ8_9FUNG|nr:hypothetical protein INT44_004308 [Umbelopsis vinacea]